MKKLLALVLALVMTLGLATVGASAAEYSDADSIEYKEAVDVMSAIGVLQGDNGAFNPKGTLTREQGAKIITYMLLGKTAADALTTPSAPFADVAADRWSAGSIAYAVSQGIIAGVGNNQFNPAGELTNAAFAKMLLVALGYDAEIEGLVGNDWMLKTASLVNKISLADGLGGVTYDKAITRDQAAKFGLNTLRATEVTYDRSRSVGTNGSSVNTDLQASYVGNNAEAADSSSNYRKPTETQTPYTQFCEEHFSNLKLNTNGSDDFGRSANVWTYKGVKVGTYAKTPAHVYTAEISTTAEKKALEADLEDYNNFDKAAAADKAGAILVVNGKVVKDGKATGEGHTGRADTTTDELAKLTGNGRRMEIFTDNNDIIKIVVVDTVLGQVTSVDKTNEKITIKALFGAADGSFAATTKGYGTFVKDDYVLVTAVTETADGNLSTDLSKDTVKSVAAATKVTGIASTKNANKGTITLAGTTYEEGARVYNDKNVAAFGVSTKNEATLYLDGEGYILYAKGGVDSSDNKAILVLEFYSALDKNGKIVPMVKGVTSDGETVTMELEAALTTEQANAMKLTVAEYADADDDNKYTLSKENLVKTTATGAAMADAKTSVQITLGAELKASAKTFTWEYNDGEAKTQRLYFDNDVKFIYLDKANEKTATRDGVQKVANGTKVNLVVEKKSDVLYVVAVYVEARATNTSVSTKDVVFVDATKRTANGYSTYDTDNKLVKFDTYDAYVEGAKVDFYTNDSNELLKNPEAEYNADTNPYVSRFFTVETDSDTGDYVLTGNKLTAYEDNDTISVSSEETYQALVNGLLTGKDAGDAEHSYNIDNAKFVDLTNREYDNFDLVKNQIESGVITAAKFMVIYDYDNGNASYVYLTGVTVAP